MNPILQTLARTISPVLVIFSLVLLLRGHHRPGGGFVGGLMAGSALTLYVLAYGFSTLARVIRFTPTRVAAVGVLLALASGLPGLFTGEAFLHGYWTVITLPGDGEVSVGTPLLFDAGVYLAVIGATLTFILQLRRHD